MHVLGDREETVDVGGQLLRRELALEDLVGDGFVSGRDGHERGAGRQGREEQEPGSPVHAVQYVTSRRLGRRGRGISTPARQ